MNCITFTVRYNLVTSVSPKSLEFVGNSFPCVVEYTQPQPTYMVTVT